MKLCPITLLYLAKDVKPTVPQLQQHQHEKHQHGLIIQQELQQLQQYQQKQMMMRQEHAMMQQANTQQPNYCMSQSSHTPPSQNRGHVDVHQGIVSNMQQIQSGPTMGIPAHHMDPNRSRHDTPVMSPMSNPLAQIHQPSHSPHTTSTPGVGQVTHFMRQGSVPSRIHSGIHTPTGAGGTNEGVSVQQLQQHLQIHMQQQSIGVTSTSPTLTQSKGIFFWMRHKFSFLHFFYFSLSGFMS